MNSLVQVTPADANSVGQWTPPVAPPAPAPREFWGMILRHGWLALAVGVGLAALVVIIALTMTPIYTASGAVMIQPRRENLAHAQRDNADNLPPDTSAIDTQVEVLRSPSLAESVVRKAKLYADPEFNHAPSKSALAGAPTARDLTLATDAFLAHTGVRRVGLTYVVTATVKSNSPTKAANLANTLLDTYLDRQVADKMSSVERANTELNGNLEMLRREAESAEAKVEEYKIANHLFSVGQSSMAEQEVSTLNTQIAQAKADAADKRARLAAAVAQVHAGNAGADVGAALGSETVRELRKKEADTSLQLAQLQADFKPDYPPVQRAQAELNDIHGQIQAEINRILSSLRAEAFAASQREASLLGSRGQAQGGLVSNNMAQVGLLGLQQKADAAKLIYEGYLNRAKEVSAEGAAQQADASIDSRATVPTHPTSPNMRLALVGAALLGLIAAALTILIAEFRQRGLRTAADIESQLGVPFAAAIPDLASVGQPAALHRGSGPTKALRDQSHSGFAEAFRNLRAFLLVTAREGVANTIAITSALPNEGKSSTSLCLAATLAQGGGKVVLVDCDVRRRGATRMVGGSDIGLVEVASGETTLERALIFDPVSGAWILPAGGRSSAPHDLFSRTSIDEILRRLSTQFDHVILDLSPVLGVADTRILAARADRTIFVTVWEKTPIRAAQSAISVLLASGAKVSGVILNKVDVKQQAKYGYGDSSDYFRYYSGYYLAA